MQWRSYIRFRHERDVVFLHRFHELFCHYITLRAQAAIVQDPDSTLWRTVVFHELYKPNRYRSATGLAVPNLYRQRVFLSLLT